MQGDGRLLGRAALGNAKLTRGGEEDLGLDVLGVCDDGGASLKSPFFDSSFKKDDSLEYDRPSMVADVMTVQFLRAPLSLVALSRAWLYESAVHFIWH